jgi:RimJ/RimL family protein N-acetyltransferase
VLRRWRLSDREPFARINADPVVMEHFPGLQSPAVSEEMIADFEQQFERDGFGLWAVEIPGEIDLAGFVGLARVAPEMPFAPVVEIGWRLTPAAWGRSIAYEGARAALDYGFGPAGLSEVVAYTTVRNERSRQLMERLGMRYEEGADFLHPKIAPNDPVAPHVVYRLSAQSYGTSA